MSATPTGTGIHQKLADPCELSDFVESFLRLALQFLRRWDHPMSPANQFPSKTGGVVSSVLTELLV